MSEREYTSRDLIEAHIDAQRKWVHDDFNQFYAAKAGALEAALGVRLDAEGVADKRRRPLWMLWRETVSSYLAIRTTRSGFLEDSLINVRLEELGKAGRSIEAIERQIGELADQSRALHLKLLGDLFAALFAPAKPSATQGELLALGFDEAKEPDISDYWDYY